MDITHALTTTQCPNIDTIVVGPTHAIIYFKNGATPQQISADTTLQLLHMLEWYLIPFDANKDIKQLTAYQSGLESTCVLNNPLKAD